MDILEDKIKLDKGIFLNAFESFGQNQDVL